MCSGSLRAVPLTEVRRERFWFNNIVDSKVLSKVEGEILQTASSLICRAESVISTVSLPSKSVAVFHLKWVFGDNNDTRCFAVILWGIKELDFGRQLTVHWLVAVKRAIAVDVHLHHNTTIDPLIYPELGSRRDLKCLVANITNIHIFTTLNNILLSQWVNDCFDFNILFFVLYNITRSKVKSHLCELT